MRRQLRDRGVVFVGRNEPEFPARLASLYDPPFGIFVRGDRDRVLMGLARGPVVAIVGSRRATPVGRATAHAISGELAERGALVVSGLAVGVDAAAHSGALAGGGATVAFAGCGVDVPYPRRNRTLAERIALDGAVISEYWPGTRPAPWRFPARNRLVAGVADAVVVVEAGRRSGSLITAE
ncbi:MAG: DNA-processing protein DprA, partial [Miltoncostaeaceae bacterium]